MKICSINLVLSSITALKEVHFDDVIIVFSNSPTIKEKLLAEGINIQGHKLNVISATETRVIACTQARSISLVACRVLYGGVSCVCCVSTWPLIQQLCVCVERFCDILQQ